MLPGQGAKIGFGPMVGVLVALVLTGGAGAAEAPPDRVPIQVRPAPALPGHTAVSFDVPGIGRYSVRVASPFGTALQLVDRMAGPGPADGVPGERDGRIDTILGPGGHKAVLTLPPKAEGKTEISVRGFTERNADAVPMLRDLDRIDTDLGDLEQRSYWLDQPNDGEVLIEAAGRRLADLRLWKDGTWLVDLEAQAETVMARPGKPLALLRLSARLPAGLYLMTLYGGAGEPWAEDSGENPLHIRRGVPNWPAGNIGAAVTSPFGFDRWKVPAENNYFRLDLPEPGPGILEVDGQRAELDKTKRDRAVDILLSSRKGTRTVMVHREAGQPYRLQLYHSAQVYTLEKGGDFWISVLRPGTGEDEVDLGAILTEGTYREERVIASRVLRLGQADGWKRRFNLLDRTTLFFEAKEAGPYKATADLDSGIDVEPFIRPQDYKPKRREYGSGTWDLDAGFYRVTLTPRDQGRGILTLTLQGGKAAVPEAFAAPVTAVTFPKVELSSHRTHRLHLNEAPEARIGALIKRLPLDLSADTVPVGLSPGETLLVPVSVRGPRRIEAVAMDGTALPVGIDQQAPVPQPAVPAGVSRVTLTNPGDKTLQALLRPILDPPPPPPPPQPLPAGRLQERPVFPVLDAGAPRFLDLDRQASATYNVQVDRPALYRLESTGLLATSGNLRTQIQPALLKAQGNGVGRNFLLQQYLREGLYQLTLATEGESKGHLGVRLAAAPLRDGGRIAPGRTARATLKEGEGIAYAVDIAETGTYRVDSLSLSRPTELRLEDPEGWPVTRPGQQGKLTLDLSPGRYRLIVAPQPLAVRVVTRVERVPGLPARSGHGPHVLPLDGTLSHEWTEPAEGEERRPDLWTFTLPAKVHLDLALGKGMEGELSRDGSADPVASFNHLRAYSGDLPAGDYRLAVRSIRPDNRLSYTLRAAVPELTVGRQRTVTAPATLPLSVGAEGLVEIASTGTADLRALLRDAAGRVVARADDRPNDWNFAINTRLPPGSYRLEVAPVGGRSATATVVMTAQNEKDDAPLTPGEARSIGDGAVHGLPLALPAADGLAVIAAQAEDPVGLALEQRAADGSWKVLGTATGTAPRLAVARAAAAKAAYRARVWSLDRTPAPIAVTLQTPALAEASEKQLAEGLAPLPLPGIEPPLAAALVRIEQPGLFRIAEGGNGLSWSAAADRRALGPAEAVIPVGAGRLWLLAGPGRVQAHRVVPDADAALALTLPGGESGAIPAPRQDGPQVWIAESRIGQPGLGAAGTDPRSGAFAKGVAAVVLPGGKGTAELLNFWRADAEDGDLPLLLRRVSFAPAERGSLDFGIADVSLAAGAARLYDLPRGAKRLRLTLPAGSAAALLDRGQVVRSLWAGPDGLAQTLAGDAQALLLLNTGKEAHFALDLSPLPAALPLAKGGLYRSWQPSAGTTRLEAALPKKGGSLVLHLTGAMDGAMALQRNGSVLTGNRLVLTDDATLVLNHGAGLGVAWLDGADEVAWPPTGIKHALPPLPATVALVGGEATWKVEAKEPGLLHLALDNPVLVGLRRPGAAPEVTAWPAGAEARLFLPQGTSRLGLRPLQDGPLSGRLVLARSAPVSLGEGVGPRVELAPGDARLFSFVLDKPGLIGVGIRAGADSARATLYDGEGKVVGEGATLMPDLAAGRYFLLVANRADGGVVAARPVLVGSTPPDKGPPEDVKRQYWQLVSEAAEER